MTTTERLTLREIDARVAWKVMGYTLRVADDESEFTTDRDLTDPGELVIESSGNPIRVPHYTTDIAAAWTVVRHFAEANINLIMQAYCYDRTYATFGDDIEESSEANGKYASETAICLAALQLHGIHVEVKDASQV